MPRLFTFAQTKFNYNDDVQSILLAADKVESVSDIAGGASIVKYQTYKGADFANYQTDVPASTVIANINVANTTNPENVMVPLTKLTMAGAADSVVNISTEAIEKVVSFPTDAGDSLVTINLPGRTAQQDFFRTAEAPSAIKALANI